MERHITLAHNSVNDLISLLIFTEQKVDELLKDNAILNDNLDDSHQQIVALKKIITYNTKKKRACSI